MDSDHSKAADFREILSRLEDIRKAANDVGKYNKTRDDPEPIPLIDPTANVLALVGHAMQRQDGLREAESRRLDELRLKQAECDKEIEVVRSQAQKDLSQAESKRIDASNLAESRRIDAVLTEMKAAVSLASEKAAAQAATLAQQVVASADALRVQVASTAVSTESLIRQTRESLEGRLSKVEQNQYQQGGASQQRSEGQLRSQWSTSLIVSIVFGVVSGGATLLLLIARILGK
jgi:hypothetical protein